MITHKGALKLLYNYASDEWNLGTTARKLIDYAYLELEKAINENETLKKDVARYFELSKNPTSNTNQNEIRPYIEWANELFGLEKQILSKVGNIHG